jgi:predicted O-methyltransferase YrrM
MPAEPPGETPSRWRTADHEAHAELAPVGAGPLPWSDWALRPVAIKAIVEEIGRRARARVVELGAGVSTVFFGRALRATEGRLVSIEHDETWADMVRQLARDEGIEDLVRVEAVPLAELPASIAVPQAEGFESPAEWLEVERTRAACGPSVDLLVVDGPPGGDQPGVLARAPAVPALRDLLAPGAVVYLDDIHRPAERRTAELWRDLLGGKLQTVVDADLAILTPES